MPASRDEIDSLTGSLLGQCHLLELIGQGGMGHVYRARHTGLDKEVAVKVLPRELCNSAAMKERFMNEARTAGQLEHPNIMPVYAVDEQQGQPYIVMQLIDGVPVSKLVGRQGVDPLLAVKISAQVARGLAFAHRHNTVHRDIKPDNLMITSNGRVKITDFGVAAALGSMLSGGHSGSPPYMSPEQCRGEQVDGRSDIYSLGVTLYLLLTGRRPFLGETPQALILMHQQDDYPKLTQLRPGLPLELERITNQMLAKKPEARYQNADELAEDLEAAGEMLRNSRRRTVSVKRGSDQSSIYRLAQKAEEAASEEFNRHETVELAILSITTQADAATGDAQRAMRQSRYDEALKQIDRALKIKPDDPRTLLLRGHIYRKQRKFKEASDDYKRAVEVNPDDPRARAFLGALQRMMGDLGGAKENLMHALKLDAMNVEARISLGKIYEKGKALTSAKREYEKAIEMVPADERAYVALAVLLIENPGLKDKHDPKNPIERARELLDKALALNPGFSETLYWLAVLTTPNSTREGMDYIERAVKNGFKDRKRLKHMAFADLEKVPAFKNLLKVFGA